MKNLIMLILSYVISRILKKPYIWANPIAYSIEPTNRCNFSCPECPLGTGALTRPLGILELHSFRNIIDQIRDKAIYLQLFFQGEPYINKSLPEMIAYAQQNRLYVSISTNGSLFRDDTIERMMSHPPDKLIFSMDGLDEETYKKYRVGGSFKEADENLKRIIAFREQRKLERPYVELQFLVMKHNEHQIQEVFDYGRRVGVDKVTLKTVQVYSVESAKEFLPEHPKFRRYVFDGSSIRVKGKRKNTCFALWKTGVITWDGDMVACCFDKDATYKFGNVQRESIDSIWRNEKFLNFREQILLNRSKIKMCNNCTEGLKINIFELEN